MQNFSVSCEIFYVYDFHYIISKERRFFLGGGGLLCTVESKNLEIDDPQKNAYIL